MTKPTATALIEALRQYGKAAAKRPLGPGWQSIDEMARAESVSVPTMRYRLKCARARGVKIDQAPGTELDENGMARRTTYYRLVVK
jgi:hypothetical protein